MCFVKGILKTRFLGRNIPLQVDYPSLEKAQSEDHHDTTTGNSTPELLWHVTSQNPGAPKHNARILIRLCARDTSETNKLYV